jgi:hypothetical protein
MYGWCVMNNLRRALAAGLLVLAGGLAPAHAHKASDAYAMLQGGDPSGTVTLQLSLAVKDLDAALPALDADNNRQMTWGELRLGLPQITGWAAQGVQVRCDAQALQPAWIFESLEQRADGAYVRVAAQLDCAAGKPLALDYQLMKDLDPTHRLLMAGSLDGKPVAAVLAPQARSAVALRGTEAAGATAAALPQTGPAILAHFLPEGVHHIATGYDHLAFLLALLLPVMLGRQAQGTGLAVSHRPGLKALVTTVTGFTVGHSITLVLATLGLIGSPAWVEPAIAITIGISALLNLYPVRWVRGDVLALGFGLIHGLGFSNIMREAGVSGPLLPWALAGFNIGVEAGQLVGVAVWCVLHLVLVRWALYDKVVVRGGSWALLALAAYWTVERLTGT